MKYALAKFAIDQIFLMNCIATHCQFKWFEGYTMKLLFNDTFIRRQTNQPEKDPSQKKERMKMKMKIDHLFFRWHSFILQQADLLNQKKNIIFISNNRKEEPLVC